MTASTAPDRRIGPDLRAQIRRGIDLVALVGGVAATLVVMPGTVSLLSLAIAMCGLIGVCFRATWTPVAYVVILFITQFLAVTSFGLLLGVGAIYILLTCIAFMFMSRAWRWCVVLGITITPVIVGLLFDRELLGAAPMYDPHDTKAWTRIVLVTAAAWIAVAVIVDYSVRSLRAARHSLEDALRSERESREARERVEAEIARTQRSDLIIELAAEVGGSIGAALATVSRCAESLTRELDSEARACLADVLAAASAASSTMRSLTLFSPGAESVEALCDAAEAARAVPQMVRRTIPQRVALELTVDDHAWVPLSNTDLIRILANLVYNARDAISGSGTIGLHVRRSEASVILEVTDDGSGMTPETRARLFQPFFTTKAIGRGTGLGLATAKILIEKAGGVIECASEQGHGTRITIRLSAVSPRGDREPA